MIADKNRIYDGWMSLEAGVDAGRTATLLEANYAASAQNMVFRGGHPSIRPGIRKLTETGATNIYKGGVFQGIIGYSPHHGADTLMAMIGGHLFKILPGINDAEVREVPLNEPNNSKLPIAYMLQADKWLIIQDGQANAILYDGNKARRSNETTSGKIRYQSDPDKTEVPPGTIMAYGMGRICVIVNDRDVAFGDLYGSHEGDDPADSLILFTERNFIGEGFDAAIPFQMGVATGMAFFPQLDTSTGNGQLLVFAERGAASFFLSLPRDQWKTSIFQVLALSTTGLRGHKSISIANEDLWFRSEDGFRSYRQARSESAGWAHIPESTNVRQYLDLDTQWLLQFASSIYFDNRIIATTSPMPQVRRPVHQGLVVVDFDILSSFGTRDSKPAWDGYWHKDGLRILQLTTGRFRGVTRAFFMAIDGNGENSLFEITMNDKDDWDGPIEWELVSRAFDFTKISQAGTVFQENEIYDADIWLREIVE